MESTVTEKIRKLLAMAEHENSNENEAAVAMQKAQELLLRHNLSRADIKTGDNGTAQAPGIGKLDITEAVGFAWKRHLLHTLAVNNLCQTVGSPSENTSHVFGTFENVKGVVEMYAWLAPELERIAMKSWQAYRDDGTGRESVKTWKKGFFMGATRSIGEKLRESMEKFTEGPGKALVPYNTGLVKDAVGRIYPNLRRSTISNRSADGSAAGRAAGRNIHLRPQRKLTGTLALKGGS